MSSPEEIETRLNNITGNMLGIQTLLLALYATSDKKSEIIEHFISDAKNTHAMLIAESTLPDAVLHQLDNWYATTVQTMMEIIQDQAQPTDTSAS